MSFAMDDLGLSYGIDSTLKTKIKENIVKVDKTTDTEASGSSRKESEVNDVFENSQSKPTSNESLQAFQEEYTAIDIKKEALNKISSYVKDIKSSIETDAPKEDLAKKVDANYEKINKMVKETSFNDKNLSEDLDKIMQQKETSAEKLDNLMKNINNKEQELINKQEQVVKRINENSIVEIKRVSETEEEEEEEEFVAQEIKKTAIKDIKEEPEKSIRMHIKHIDKDLLLAMLSLKSG